jgi:hypothetical protein
MRIHEDFSKLSSINPRMKTQFGVDGGDLLGFREVPPHSHRIGFPLTSGEGLATGDLLVIGVVAHRHPADIAAEIVVPFGSGP